MEKKPITGDKIPHPVGGRWTTCWPRRRAAAPSTPCGQRAPTSPQPSDLGKPASRRGGCGRPWDNEESPQGVEAAKPLPAVDSSPSHATIRTASSLRRVVPSCGPAAGRLRKRSAEGGTGRPWEASRRVWETPGHIVAGGVRAVPRPASGRGSRRRPVPRAGGWGALVACRRLPRRGHVSEAGCRSGAGAGAVRGPGTPPSAPRRGGAAAAAAALPPPRGAGSRQPAVRRQPFLMRLVSSVTWL